MNSNTKKDSTVAVEEYTPDLSPKYLNQFKKLVTKLGQSLPINRNQIIDAEIKKLEVGIIGECEDLDILKYGASLNVLKDLSQQGWCFVIQGDLLKLRMEEENLDDKAHIRYRLSAERDAQFKVDSIRKFIIRMEAPRSHNGEQVSVRNLIGDRDELVRFIQNNDRVCAP